MEDRGDLIPQLRRKIEHSNPRLCNLADSAGWTRTLEDAAFEASETGFLIFLGGDHSHSAGTVSGLSRRAEAEGRPLFVRWLDAHPDFYTLESTTSGNLHGTPMACATGQAGFEPAVPGPDFSVRPENLCMIGLRSVDPAECRALGEAVVDVHDMRVVDEIGMATLLRKFLEWVRKANGRLHVSLDVDFLGPGIAPGDGTTMPGGATFRETHLVGTVRNFVWGGHSGPIGWTRWHDAKPRTYPMRFWTSFCPAPIPRRRLIPAGFWTI